MTWVLALHAHGQPTSPPSPTWPALARDQAATGDRPIVPGSDDPTFGPMLVIEDIALEGNESTAARVILRALPIARGEVLRAGDPRFQKARFKLLATGYFRAVELDLRKGSERGHVILVVKVKERGTVVLNNMYFGTSLATPWWAGLDITERNFVGTGLGLGGGLVHAAGGEIEGARDQWALRLRLADSSILGTPIGAHGTFLYNQASEPYRVRGSDASAADFRAFSYSRVGVKGGLTLDVTPLARLAVDGRAEQVDADPPLAATRELDDGSIVPVDIGLEPGRSRVVTLAVGFDRDTRADPVLPFNGDRLVLLGEFGATWLGGSYNYALALARYQHWWPIRPSQHVLSIHLTGGLVLGEAPRFDRLHASDFNRLLTPRALGLVVSTTTSQDFLGTQADDSTYGEVGGSAVVEYSYQLFRSRFHVYGGDLFVGAGLWALARRRDLLVRDRSLYRALPVDLVIDAGLRIDTEVGIFELTFANALGRVPL
jgi:outer membrane protein insertion porin family